MEIEISEIYRVRYFDKFSYIGTLRNEKKFNIEDKVFFAIYDNNIVKGEIVGIELEGKTNPKYVYKIKIPEYLVKRMIGKKSFVRWEEPNKVKLTCSRIFKSLDEAKVSAIQELERLYKTQKEDIETYFKHWSN